MKKIFSLLAVLALVSMVSSSVFADPLARKTARVSFSSQELVFDVEIFDFNANTPWAEYSGEASNISFDTTGITYGSDEPFYAKGTTFARIHSNLTAQQAGTMIYMYTRNNADTGDYKANAYRTEIWEGTNVNLYNGLVRSGNTETYQKGDFAPMKIKCVKSSEAAIDALPANFWELGADSGVRSLLDKDDSIFASYPENAKSIGKSGVGGGIWVGYGNNPATNWYANEDVIVFFAAQFTNVMGGSSYGTDTIVFNQSIE